jgi:hypothetical protein
VKGLKPTLVSAVAIGLLAGSTIGVAAQKDEAAAEPTTPAKVTGTYTPQGDVVQEPTETVVDGILEGRDWIVEAETIEMDDPRLSGSVTRMLNANVHKVNDFEDVVLETSFHRIENEAGSRSGQGTALVHGGAEISQDEATNLDTVMLTGEGAFVGLSAYLVFDWTEDPITVEGVAFAGGMPPFPVLPAE